MKLTKIQLQFLERHCISVDQVFDATGLSKSEYQKQMKDGGFLIAIGLSRCRRKNHYLKDRYGHCVVCHPATIAFQKRETNPGDLYVMYSPSNKLVKVGVANSSKERLISANKQGYGNIKDWKLKFSLRVDDSGQAERIIHNLLADYKQEREFVKGGSIVIAQEIFKCSGKRAIEVIESAFVRT